MEFRQLEYFVSVVNTGSFTQSANTLHVSQPALSRIIKRLEDEIGFTLFIRGKDNVRLTTQGRIFLDAVNSALFTLQDSISTCRGIASPTTSTISVAMSYRDVGDNTLVAFQQENPGLQIRQFVLPPDAIQSRLLTQYVDFAITSDLFTEIQINWRPLFVDELLLEVPKEHPYYAKGILPIDMLQTQRFIIDDSIYDRPTFERACGEISVIPNIVFQCNEHGLAQEYIKKYHGITFVPLSTVYECGVTTLPPQYLHMENTIFKRSIGIAKIEHRSLPVMAEEYLNYVTSYYSDLRTTMMQCVL